MWRFICAGKFGALLLIFILPWVDIRCQDKNTGQSGTIVTQSGMQAARSGFTVAGVGRIAQGPEFQQGEQLDGAPLMVAYGLALLAGFIVCALFPPNKLWVIIVGTCAAVAVVTLAVQTVIGFPIADAIKEQMNANPFGPNPKDVEVTVAYHLFFYVAWVVTLALPVGVWMAAIEKPERRLRPRYELRGDGIGPENPFADEEPPSPPAATADANPPANP
jgi:hypothetical protein